jgi:cytochrome b6-f complex iron-sulfur subunit
MPRFAAIGEQAVARMLLWSRPGALVRASRETGDDMRQNDSNDNAEDEADDTHTPAADATPATSRRRFLDTTIVGGSAVVGLASVYPALRFLEPLAGAAAASAIVAKVADFSAGTSKSARLGDTPVLVIRDDEGTFRAYEAICPHLQCVVHFAKATDEIACACHGGKFSLSGSPKAGPPKRPLKVLRVNVIGDDVVVSRG